MGITTFYFLLFIIASGIVYYLCPLKLQNLWLFLISIVYFATTLQEPGQIAILLYPLWAVSISYFVGLAMGNGSISYNRFISDGKISSGIVIACGVVLLVLPLAVLKYFNFFIYTVNGIIRFFEGELFDPVAFLVPIGISFYTMSLLSYVLDIYYGRQQPERNFLHLLVFGMYFPALVTGPIMSYRDLAPQLEKKRRLDYRQVAFGAQRILWGFFKVLVVSGRIAIPVKMVFDRYESTFGIYILLGALGFGIQLYTNFSGSIDILLGVSQCFGIVLPENFRAPLFSVSISEFWRRWHITLGEWMKNYVFYPLLRTEFFKKMPDKLMGSSSIGDKELRKKRRKTAKNITTFAAMLVMWFTVGLWHGGAWKYIIGSGILHWFYILLEEAPDKLWERLRSIFHIDRKNIVYRIWCCIRTYFLVCFGFLFFNASSLRVGLIMVRHLFNRSLFLKNETDIGFLGLELKDWIILAVGVVVVLLVDYIGIRTDIRNRVASLPLIPRWMVYYGFLFAVILMGQYGPGYSAAEFIYRGF